MAFKRLFIYLLNGKGFRQVGGNDSNDGELTLL
jgi:hypothetical protein